MDKHEKKGQMPGGGMDEVTAFPGVDKAIDRNVTRLIDEVVEKAVASIGDPAERELVAEGVAAVLRETLHEVAEEEVARRVAASPTATSSRTGAMTFGDGANTGIGVAGQVNKLGFVEFTAGLINGTFDAIIGATVKQMDAYSKMVADLAKTLAEFRAEYVSESQITAYLAERYPDGEGGTSIRPSYEFTATAADTDAGIPGKSAEQKLAEVVASLEVETRRLAEADRISATGLGLTGAEKSLLGTQVGEIRDAIGKLLATSMVEHLRAMAREGMARIVISQGEICTALTFSVSSTDTAAVQKSQYHRDSAGAYIRGGAWAPWGTVQAGGSWNQLNINTVNEQNYSSVSMNAEMIGKVKLQFRTESFPPAVTAGA